ncbi:hypothetical protein B0T19DRAFT_440819 [Cercophora scortea]|uniref:Uncharacterized protein n=1 Tax=Cercophora scortea TaxID=314031 RepID=A0AAE0MIR1_9PEZI|nr:hypothetical protein B0T19DRAFT_440819 [Cercophora scortea]
METAYQLPAMASYEKHHMQQHHTYASTVAPSDRIRPALNERPAPNEQLFNPAARNACPSSQSSRDYQQQQQQYQASLPQLRPFTFSSSSAPTATASSSTTGRPSRQPGSRQSTAASTPNSGGTMAKRGLSPRDSSMVKHSLEIPKCISPEGGNLADFVAEVTALFWFESIQVFEAAEKVRTIPHTTPVRRITESALANQHFKKWVHSVLSTTQVTQNVILLALMFIYRLKVANPTVKGRTGSEYRLLTVALMLGNKFLDDNTYTNKTWADVSGISVGEIHVMEVEFLSNMRYSLLASKEQWEEWLVKLAKFWEYQERARAQRAASPSPLLIPSPTHRDSVSGPGSPLPSPTGALHLQLTPSAQPTVSPQTLRGYSPSPSEYAPKKIWPVTYAGANSTVSPLNYQPETHHVQQYGHTPTLPSNSRKRSVAEEDPTDHPAKRMSRVVVPPPTSQMPSARHQPAYAPVSGPGPLQPQGQNVSSQSRPGGALEHQQPRLSLSVPNLALHTATLVNTGTTTPTQPYHGTAYAPQQASPLSLPPIVPGVRAMTSVFPPAMPAYAPHNPVSTAACPSVPSAAPAATPTTNYPPASYGTPTRRLSPQHTHTPTAPYASSSPLNDAHYHHPYANAGSASGMHTPISHSPSIYLQQRNSPYKPIRHVNTLLHPPPSAFLHQYHFPNAVPPNQMHYQPLGRRNELRTGIVPEFAMASGGQQYATTPASYPSSMSHVLPNPNQPRPALAGRSSLSYQQPN